MRFLTWILGGTLLLGQWYGCATLPKNTHTVYEKITTGHGPEDFVLDTVSGDSALLLISCTDHRGSIKNKGKALNGDIYMLNLDRDSLTAERMYRSGEPEGLDFHPHGMYLCSDTTQTHHYLYIVSHDEIKNEHPIYKYEISGNTLVYVRRYDDKLIHSPNSVAALPNGSFYASNDAGKRGNRMEALFRLRKSTIIQCDADGKCAKAADKIAFANGLSIVDNHHLYLGTTRHDRLFRYTIEYNGNLVDRQAIAKTAGADNVRNHEGFAYVTSHLRILAFVAHYQNPKKLSPTVVYKINEQTGERLVAYSNKGEQISAGSVALPYKGYLYVGQVFEPFIIRVKQ